MKNAKSLLPLALTACLFAGCASTPETVTPSPEQRLTEARKEVKDFGIWQLRSCQIYARRADIEIFTDGRMTANQIFFRLHSLKPLDSAPKLSIWGVGGFNVDLDGREQNWSFKFPFGPADVAKMINDRIFIVVGYTPTSKGSLLNAVFSAQDLPRALTYLSENCLDTSDK